MKTGFTGIKVFSSGSRAIWVLAALLLVAFGSNLFAQSGNSIEEQQQRQVQMIADALADPGVFVAYCKIPESAQITRSDNGKVAEVEPNYCEVVVALSISRVSVSEAPRGDMDSVIFIRSMPRLTEGPYTPIFSSEPGSEWLLLLESPFDTEHPDHEMLMARYRDTEAQSFLTPRNFFTVYGDGCGALCVKWSGNDDTRPPVVATPEVIDDVTLIIDWMRNVSDEAQEEQTVSDRRELMKDELGIQLYEKLFAR